MMRKPHVCPRCGYVMEPLAPRAWWPPADSWHVCGGCRLVVGKASMNSPLGALSLTPLTLEEVIDNLLAGTVVARA